MKAEFTETEKELLKGHKKALARKLGVSHTYVNKIVSGEYNVETELSQNIFNAAKAALELFTPEPQKSA